MVTQGRGFVEALEQIAYHHLLVDDHSDVHRALDKVAEAVDQWADLGVHDRTRDVSSPTGAPQDLELPASLFPEMPDPTLEGSGLGL